MNSSYLFASLFCLVKETLFDTRFTKTFFYLFESLNTCVTVISFETPSIDGSLRSYLWFRATRGFSAINTQVCETARRLLRLQQRFWRNFLSVAQRWDCREYLTSGIMSTYKPIVCWIRTRFCCFTYFRSSCRTYTCFWKQRTLSLVAFCVFFSIHAVRVSSLSQPSLSSNVLIHEPCCSCTVRFNVPQKFRLRCTNNLKVEDSRKKNDENIPWPAKIFERFPWNFFFFYEYEIYEFE